MNKHTAISLIAVLTIAGSSMATDESIPLKTLRLNGPRMGLTAIVPDGGTWEKELENRGVEHFVSQFGWHHEWVIAPELRGPAFVIQTIALLGGVEYGIVIPSTSLVMGIRLPMGFEFGMGPNILAVDSRERPIHSSLIVAVGQSLNFNGVNIPLNLAWNRNNEGNRVSFVFGYALTTRKDRDDQVASAMN
jgi:hypothetical protein